MAIARFKDLCLDASQPSRLGPFWAKILDLIWEPDAEGEGKIVGPTPQHTIWVNRVHESKTVKHRVHLDMYSSNLSDLQALGSNIVLPEGDGRRWTVMADPEDGEYCAFLRTDLPPERLHGLVVDSADPAAQARWWATVYDATVIDDPHGFSTVENIPGMPIRTMDFVPVPEPKTVKNRIHWDVSVKDLQPLIDAGATVVRPQGADIAWHIMADPEGNEFCAFQPH